MVKSFIFGSPRERMDLAGALAIVQDVRGAKDMISAKLLDQGPQHRNVRLGIGGIREIEFLT